MPTTAAPTTAAPTSLHVGENCPVCGPASGAVPAATGAGAVAMGVGTAATATASAAMGQGITANETESLALSGTAYAKDFRFITDARLVKNVRHADPATMLRALGRLSVVTHEPSDHYCAHQGRAPEHCARDRVAGLLAHEVAAAIPGAVRVGTSLTLSDRTGGTLEHVPDVRSLDVRALLAQLVGSVQALRAQNEAQAGEIAELKKTVALLS